MSSYGFGSYDSYGYNGGFNFSNKAPEADYFLETNEDTPLIIKLPDNATVTKDPIKGVVNKNQTELVYSPDANFYGIDEIVYEYTDESGQQATVFVLIDVLPVDDAPHNESINVTTREDNSVNLTFNNLDLDNEKLSFTLISSGKAKEVKFLGSVLKSMLRYFVKKSIFI